MPLFDYSFLGKIIPQQKHKKSYRKAKQTYLNRIRLAMSFFYFGMGFCFASWASRIPDIKSFLNLSEGELGTILFALPIGQLTAMPFSGKLVTRFGSRKVLLLSLILYAFCLTNIGLAEKTWQLALGLYLFGICGNFSNISINTQGVYTEQIFGKPIMGSFHGSWSLAGFCGALVGLVMLAFKLSPYQHFIIVFAIVGLLIFINYRFLIKVKAVKQEIDIAKPKFRMPDKSLIWLGVIGFCCMASEGIMFDWSGVYFKDIVKAPGALVILGYTSFMITMASGRFLSDILVRKYGAKKILIVSGITISLGLYTAVVFPFLIPSTIAFMMVGFGVSNVIPIIYSAAGRNTTIPTGEALTIVTGISFLGFLIGPPVIGHIAELTSLRYSFGFIGIFGVFISVLAYYLKIFR
ncbi:MFS transporter [Flavobacterium azooxidireducens]|uniref:MFS transporter n=1 Tax=Flavobacterium azooxidireducens TaxID=1871076 RepID=A0ABY4KEV4_9FLAO|nr:MFS transporter [Flavobacterium azooxidireducens]UPQ79317.1 MFS transporter [Flavobacterium azooxidireducens]